MFLNNHILDNILSDIPLNKSEVYHIKYDITVSVSKSGVTTKQYWQTAKTLRDKYIHCVQKILTLIFSSMSSSRQPFGRYYQTFITKKFLFVSILSTIIDYHFSRKSHTWQYKLHFWQDQTKQTLNFAQRYYIINFRYISFCGNKSIIWHQNETMMMSST